MPMLNSHSWFIPPEDLSLPRNEIHIWCASLDVPSSTARSLLKLLSPDEVDRADSFYFEPERSRFIIRRGCLRMILSRYLGVLPEGLCYLYNSFGKPSLNTKTAQNGIYFNVSHSNELALFAFSMQKEIGVDIEYIRSDIEIDQIAQTLFSSPEKHSLDSLTDRDKLEGFYNCWTRKEAFIKAIGMGLSIPLDQFDVSLVPGEAPFLLALRSELTDIEKWTILDLQPAPGYVGALAIEKGDWNLKSWRWDASSIQ